MAGGKQTPRQKMINLMYLVFIAMMALNMSKEVLSAFGSINESFNEANTAATARNANFMAGLAEKASEQPKQYKPLQEKAAKISAASSDLYNFIGELKAGALEGVKDPKDYETMDKTAYFDELFWKGGKLQPKGEELMNKIIAYRQTVIGELGEGYDDIKKDVADKFSTGGDDNKVATRDGIKKHWVNYHYVGFPLIASVTKLTKIQADIKTTESQVLSAMLQGQMTSQLSMSNYKAIVVPEKTAFFSGESFKGKVVLGRFDNSLTFDKVVINNKELENQTGQVELEFPAGNVGQQEIKGELQFKEGDSIVSIPVESAYTVIPEPNSAVISADKMNVVYRGVKNPMTISIPGVPQVNAQAPGLSPASGAGAYVMDVTNVKAREVKINVSGTLPGGKSVSSSKVFRIKEIPRPLGVIGAKDGGNGAIRMSKRAVEVSPVAAKLPDFDFDLNLNVSGFKFQVMGKPVVQVNGNRLNAAAKAALNSAKRGAVVQIFDIQAKVAGNSKYQLQRVNPLIIELQD